MANYCGFTRTNYFRVTDPDRLEKIIAATCLSEDTLELWTREDETGFSYAFGGYGSIEGLSKAYFGHDANKIRNDDEDEDIDDDDPDFDAFERELQKIIDPHDAIIITEVGHEKLRYLTAYSIIITAKESKCTGLLESSIDVARCLLDNPDWNTRAEF